MNGQFSGRVAWVTGAAGTLGVAISQALGSEGASLVLSGRNAEALKLEAEKLKGLVGRPIVVEPLDISRQEQVTGAATRISDRFGRLDILVNCTALPIFGDFLELTDSDWELVIQAKFLGYVRTMRAALPIMMKQSFGRIINVTGRGGRQPTPAHLPGSSVNAAVNLLTKGLSNVYGRNNIRINAVAPGPIESPRLDRIAASNESVQANRQTTTGTPLNRLGTAQDVANAVIFLASDQSAYTTGTVLQVDGGGTAAL